VDAAKLAELLGKVVPAGTELFQQGDDGAEMFVIQTGAVRVSRRVGNTDRTLSILGPGEIVGEMAVLIGEKRTATATVVEDAKIVMLDAGMLETLVQKNTEIAVRLLKKVAYRLKSANEMIEILLHKNPQIRVVKGLAHLVQERGVEREDGGWYFETSIDELAGQIGVEAEQAGESLRRLEKGGHIIPESPGVWVVKDLPRLTEYVEFLEAREKSGELEG
jgi:CRP/FNR family transcriptional regulator, cyclic AMP receptor protein